MKPKTWYLMLSVAGALIPCSRFTPFLSQYGLESRLLFEQFFSTSGRGFVGTEAIVSLAALWVLIGIEGRRSQMTRLWVPVAASLLVGVSLVCLCFSTCARHGYRARCGPVEGVKRKRLWLGVCATGPELG
jgi:hypothetical protein